MSQKSTPYVIPFGTAGMLAHPNRWRAQPGELFLAQNVTVENDLLQKEPAAAYYDTQGVDALSLSGTWPASTPHWLAMATWYVGTATTARTDQTLVQIGIAPGAGWWTPPLTFSNPFTPGMVHVVRLVRSGSGPLAVAVGDSKSNTYTLAQDVTETSGSVRAQLWMSVLTTALVSGTDKLLFLLGDGTATVAAYGSAYQNFPVPLVVAAQTSASGTGTAFTTPQTHASTYPLIGLGTAVASSVVGVGISVTTPWVPGTRTVAPTFELTPAYTFPILSSGRIVAQTVWTSDEPSTPAGTVTVAAGDTTVTGSGTTFSTTYRPGDTIYVGGESQIVDHVTDATHLTTIGPWQIAQSAVAFARRAGPVVVTAVTEDGVIPGFLYKETPTPGALGDKGALTGITLTSDVMKSTVGRFVRGGKEIAANTHPRKLFYFNGAAQIHVLSGDATTMHVIAKPTADWGTADDPTKQPINGIVYQYRLWAFGNLNQPHNVYASNSLDHEDFQNINPADSAGNTPTFQLTLASSVGTRLYGAAVYQGVLFFWKYPFGIFYIDDTAGADPITAPWGYRPRSLAVGCAPSPHAVLATDDDVIFCDAEGHFHLLSAVASLGGTRESDLTRMLGLHTWTAQNVDITALASMCSTYDEQTKIAWFGLRSLQATGPGNDLIIRWDTSLLAGNGPIRVTTSRLWRPTALCTKRRDFQGRTAVLIAEATNSWFVQPGVYGTRTNYDSVAGAPVALGVPTTVQLPELELVDVQPPPLGQARRKAFRALEIVSNGAAVPPQTLTIGVVVDTIPRQTLRVPTGPTRRRILKLNAGDGYACQVTLSTDGSVSGDVPLVGLVLYYDLLSTDMSRAS